MRWLSVDIRQFAARDQSSQFDRLAIKHLHELGGGFAKRLEPRVDKADIEMNRLNQRHDDQPAVLGHELVSITARNTSMCRSLNTIVLASGPSP